MPPIPGTLVVNIGKGMYKKSLFEISTWVDMRYLLALEFVTGGLGLARATSESHVLSPKGTTPRYSVPFFQNIGLSIRLADQIIKCKYLLVLVVAPIIFNSSFHTSPSRDFEAARRTGTCIGYRL